MIFSGDTDCMSLKVHLEIQNKFDYKVFTLNWIGL